MDPTAAELISRLRQSPDDHQAFQALRAHYQHIGDHASLANLLEGWAARQRDETAAHAYYEAAELVERYLGDHARACTLLERALEQNPHHTEAFRYLIGLLENAGDHRQLLELLQRQSTALARRGDGPARAKVELHMGQIYETQLGRPDRAIAHYRKAFEADPTMVPAIYAAREIYRNAGNLKAAASLFELEVKAEGSAERRVALLRELAHLRMHDLKDVHGAVHALERAQTEAPGDLAVAHELATALLARAQQREGPAAHQERVRAADLLVQLASRTPAEHAIAYCESALDAVPGHDPALELLESLAAEHGRSDLLAVRWVGYLHVVTEGPEVSRRRRLLGFAYLEAGQDSDAVVCLEPLLADGDSEAAEALVELFRRLGRNADATRALGVAVQGLPPEERAPRLREIIEGFLTEGDQASALAHARELIELEPGDLTALKLLEDDARQRNDQHALRDLMLTTSRAPGISAELRQSRLREVARMSEAELDDPDGAIVAWQALAAVNPASEEAQDELARLLELRGRWDELVAVVEKQALGATEPETRVELLRRLVRVHRHHRQDPDAAIKALRSLREIRPDDEDARNALQEILLESGDFANALPLLEERIETSVGDEKVRLLDLLAETLESQLGDRDGAFAAAARILDEDAGNLPALDRMERIDSETQNLTRLVETLAYRGEVSPEERPTILARIGRLCDEGLGELDRAAEYYQQALDLDGENVEILDALCSVYDRAERYRDLVVLLRERAQIETDGNAKAELYRRIARTLAERVHNEDAAAEAWERVLETGEDEEALRALRAHAQYRGDADALERYLGRLAEITDDDEERRDLKLERSDVLASLERPDEAAAVLRTEVLPLDPNHLGAIQRLTRLSELLEDDASLADALERQLAILEDPGLRQPLAERLANLYDGSLATPSKAIDALYHWAQCDPMDTEPRLRLVAHLERSERFTELVEVLDGLAEVVSITDDPGPHIRHAATVAATKLDDWDGAWNRLAPRAAEDPEADAMLREFAAQADRHPQLVDLFVRLAQQAEDDETQRKRWVDAAHVFEGPLEDPNKALEAMLRAYALDLADESMLGEVERLAAGADAWPRLAQVYERLLKTVESKDAKRKLLMRHARLLDQRDPSEALDRVLRACALDPSDEETLVAAEELAPRAGRADELLIVYDRRRQKADDDGGRIDALLRAARLCDSGLLDREQAFQYVAPAIALTIRSPELIDRIEACIHAMDENRPELGASDAKKTLVGVYRAIAERSEENPAGGAELLLRAARILDELGDSAEAFRCRLLAATYAALPHVLDEVEESAAALGREVDLDRHFAKLVEDALDQNTAVDLLRRRGALLERLERFREAADVYRRLAMLRKDDADVADRMLHCLRHTGEYQDLLVALDREIARSDDDARTLALLREAAVVWERKLGNRWEAIDCLKKVLERAPDDEDASEALERLNRGEVIRDEPDPPKEEPAHLGDSDPDTLDAPLDAPLETESSDDDSLTQLLDSAPGPLGFGDFTMAESESSLEDEFGDVRAPAPEPEGMAFEETRVASDESLEISDVISDVIGDVVEDLEEPDSVPVRESTPGPIEAPPHESVSEGTAELDLAELESASLEDPFLEPSEEDPFASDAFAPLGETADSTAELSEEDLEGSGSYDLVDDVELQAIVEDLDDIEDDIEDLGDDLLMEGEESIEELDAADLLEQPEPLQPPRTSVPPPPPTSVPPPPPKPKD